MRILIDMDGTGFGWCEGIESVLEHAELGGHPVTEYIDWAYWDGVAPGAPEAVGAYIRAAQASEGFYSRLEPYPGFTETVMKLAAAGHSVFFVSTPDSTNPGSSSEKRASIEAHFGVDWGKRLILTHDKTLVRGDVLVDDKPEITGEAEPEWKHVLFDQPYNRGVDGPRITEWNPALVKTFEAVFG
jgi:5'-nucleotidase